MEPVKIAVLPGDGIGPEVIAQAVRVLKAAGDTFGLSFEIETGAIGQAAFDTTGKMLPPETLRLCRAAGAILLGPVGGSLWEHPSGLNHPKQALLKLRSWLGTFATLRPIRLSPTLASSSPLKPDQQALDLLVVYDHSSGLHYGTPRGIETTPNGQVATNTEIYTTAEVARTARIAFGEARERSGRVISIDQSKFLETGQLWRDTVEVIALEFPEVTLTRIDADNFFFHLALDATRFDVVLAESILGELVSASAVGLTGTYALHAAAYLGDAGPGVFQPSHGAAPDIAGKGVANPIGAIRAVAMMLDCHWGRPEAAEAVERAIEDVIAQGCVTADIASPDQVPRSTADVGEAVATAIRRQGIRALPGLKGRNG